MRAILERIAQEPRVQRVKLTVNAEQSSAVALYTSMGFEVVDRVSSERGDVKIHDELVMVKA